MRERLVIYGASGHGRVIQDAARTEGWDVVGFVDDDPAKQGLVVHGVSVVACGRDQALEWCRRNDAHLILGVGKNRARMGLYRELSSMGARWAKVVHASAVVSPSAVVGSGSVLFAGVVVNADSCVGENAIVNTSASLDHDNVLAEHSHVSPGVHLGGTVSVGEGSHVGVGATVRNNVRIGAWCVVGAGAVVVRDVPDGMVVVGVPARELRKELR